MRSYWGTGSPLNGVGRGVKWGWGYLPQGGVGESSEPIIGSNYSLIPSTTFEAPLPAKKHVKYSKPSHCNGVQRLQALSYVAK